MGRLGFSLFSVVSGKVGDCVFYQSRGRTCVRSLARRSGKAPSERQLEQQCRFGAVNVFYKTIRDTLLHEVWARASRGKPQTGANLFVSRNIEAFNSRGEVEDCRMLHFSTGSLPNSHCFKVEYVGEGCLEVRWKQSALLRERDDDRFMAVVVYCDLSYVVVSPEEVNARRSEQLARVVLTKELAVKGLFCFFADARMMSYSRDVAVML